jgi:hypothetical protein
LSTSQLPLHKSLPSVCVSVCESLLSLLDNGSVNCNPPFIVRQRSFKHLPAAINRRNNRRIVGSVCLWVCLWIPISLLGNNSIKTILWQRRIVEGVVFHAVSVVSKENRQLFFPPDLAMP